MRLCVASFALMSFLAGGAATGQTARGSCARVEVTSGPPARSLSSSILVPTPPRFEVTKILDLTFTVLLPASTEGEHLVELRVFTPDAQLYRSMAMPVARSAPANATRKVEGYGRPLPQQALTQVSRGRSLFRAASTRFPVAGTDIVSSGLYGRWRVEAYLDGAEQVCGPAASFVLHP